MGFPLDWWCRGLYGYVSATKWLSDIELTHLGELQRLLDSPRLVPRRGPIKTQSRIDVPRRGSVIDPGPTAICRGGLGAHPGHRTGGGAGERRAVGGGRSQP